MTHTGNPLMTPREPTVLIEGQPAILAGQLAENNNLTIVSGEPTVLAAGQPAAILHGNAAGKSSGKPTVLVASRPAAES